MYANVGIGSISPIGTGIDMSSTNASEFLISDVVQIEEIGMVIKTATNSSSPIVVTVTGRPTVGSASGAIAIGTITIPTGIVAGKMYTNKVNPVQLYPGYSINFAVTSAASVAGAAYPVIRAAFGAETDLNLAYVTVVTA